MIQSLQSPILGEGERKAVQMYVRGDTKSSMPDDCGAKAGKFVELVCDKNMWLAWNFLSNESRGIWEGIYLTRKGLEPMGVYKSADLQKDKLFDTILEDLYIELIKTWGQANIVNLGIAPTKYLDDQRALVRLVIGVSEPLVIEKETALPIIIIPLIFEDGQWKIHFPGYGWL